MTRQLKLVRPGPAAQQPRVFDVDAIEQRITMATHAPSRESRDLAREVLVDDARRLLAIVRVLVGERDHALNRLGQLAAQNADVGTINAALLFQLGGLVRFDAEWFEAWQPIGAMVVETLEEDGRSWLQFRFDPDAAPGVVSADQQPTESA